MPTYDPHKIPNVGVGAIIARGRHVLLIRRAGAMGCHRWSPTGGYLEFGEGFAACANREAEEEIGYANGGFFFLAVSNDIFEGRHFATVRMISAPREDWAIVKAPEEVAEAAWFDIGALPEPLFVPFENLVSGAKLQACARPPLKSRQDPSRQKTSSRWCGRTQSMPPCLSGCRTFACRDAT